MTSWQPNRSRILAAAQAILAEGSEPTSATVAARSGCEISTVRRNLEILRSLGQLPECDELSEGFLVFRTTLPQREYASATGPAMRLEELAAVDQEIAERRLALTTT